jgi:hypothetical protein
MQRKEISPATTNETNEKKKTQFFEDFLKPENQTKKKIMQ